MTAAIGVSVTEEEARRTGPGGGSLLVPDAEARRIICGVGGAGTTDDDRRTGLGGRPQPTVCAPPLTNRTGALVDRAGTVVGVVEVWAHGLLVAGQCLQMPQARHSSGRQVALRQ